MKKWGILLIFFGTSASVWADNNTSSPDADVNATTQAQLVKHVKEQLKREEHFAKTQSFAQGDDYNLSEHQVDPKDVESVPMIEPEYDFNMDDVYD